MLPNPDRLLRCRLLLHVFLLAPILYLSSDCPRGPLLHSSGKGK